jgi:hypothetical protein
MDICPNRILGDERTEAFSTVVLHRLLFEQFIQTMTGPGEFLTKPLNGHQRGTKIMRDDMH